MSLTPLPPSPFPQGKCTSGAYFLPYRPWMVPYFLSLKGEHCTLMRFQKYAFCCHRKHIDRAMSTLLLTCFRLSPQTHSKTIEVHVMMSVEVYAHATNTCKYAHAIVLVIICTLMHFRPFLTIHTNTICITICILSRAWQINVFSMKTLSIPVLNNNYY